MSTPAATRRNEILERALSIAGCDLAAFLDEACAGDSRLRGELERLLHVHAQMGTWSLTPASHAPRPPFETGGWLGRYELQGILGCGGMGIVYRAYDPVIGRKVAVKVLTQGGDRRAQQTSRFLSELRILGSIVHDNVVRVYDYGDADDVRYIVMELLEGEDLGRAVAAGRCGDLARKLEIMSEVAAALEHIHAAGIIHRDLKPANVFLEASGRVKLMDFGIAHSDDAFGTAPGEVIGTPQYMAPEQRKGVPSGPAMDVYSFGIVLAEVLTGERPFSLDALIAVGLPAEVIALIRHATNKDPAHRPQSFSAIVEVLGRASSEVRNAQPIPARALRRQRPVTVAACVSFALLSVSGVRPNPQGAAALLLPSTTIIHAPTELIPARAAAGRAVTTVDPQHVPTEHRREIERNAPHAPETGVWRREEAASANDAPPAAPLVQLAAVAAESAPEVARDPESADGDDAARLARELDARAESKAEILSLLERYAAAFRARNVNEIAALWPGLEAGRLRTIEASFANAEKFEFTLEADREPELSEPAEHSAYASASYRGMAVVACRRRVQMIDRSGVRPNPSESRVAVQLVRVDNKWTISRIDELN